VVKRIVDVLFSASLLVIALPVLLFASIVIRCTSPGPVFFRQVRMGRGFKTFAIFKLRTMAHAQAGLAYTLGPDPRITPVGVWLRRTKLDELPQLWNVLRGDMSMVGPRPVLPELTFEYHEYYSFLLRVRPGLTDPASLKYSQETRLLARAADPMRFFKTVVIPDKLRISFEYLARANFWTDTVTMGMTALICCFPSISRRYGTLPDIPDYPLAPINSVSRTIEIDSVQVAESRPESAQWTRPRARAVNESIFSHDLAYLEAAAEEASRLRLLPWNPLQGRDFESQSATADAKGGASRL
jgi:lipopolysaccharide/colanic/teichoic acid biosynthesis glycosyltransferase